MKIVRVEYIVALTGEDGKNELVNKERILSELDSIDPDHAVSRACVSYHKAHPESPKRDFKLNDAMGGLAIQVPLE